MFFRKKKRVIEAVTKRTEDTVPFVVPQIESKEEKAGYIANRFVSPIFGTKVKDDVIIPTPYSRTGDLDRQLDSFRTKKKLTLTSPPPPQSQAKPGHWQLLGGQR